MDKCFKARLAWRAGIEALSDAEAGRLAKALWRFAENGEAPDLPGNEKFIFVMCAADIRKDGEE